MRPRHAPRYRFCFLASGMADEIAIHAISTRACIGTSSWNHSSVFDEPQPVLVSLWTPYDLALAGDSDDLAHSLNYAAVCQTIETCFTAPAFFSSPEEAAERVARACFDEHPTLTTLRLRVEKPRAALHAKSLGVEITRHRVPSSAPPVPDAFIVTDLKLDTIVGVNSCEREHLQTVVLNLRLEPSSPADGPFPVSEVVREISDTVLKSSYLTLEALTANIADVSLRSCSKVSVRVAKPSALMFASAPEVSITRERPWLGVDVVNARKVVAIAFGSNIGNRFKNIDDALRQLEANNVKVLSTSFLYETKPMYVEDQAQFLNGACLVETSLGPMDLLHLLKQIERKVGRVASFHNGPRAIDLDVVFWGTEALSIDSNEPIGEGEIGVNNLVVPHPRLQEREFVLRPLADSLSILPHFVHPVLHRPVRQLLKEVCQTSASTAHRVVEFPNGDESLTHWKWGERTFIMATLNVTPDSFSDGGDYTSLDAAVGYALRAVEDGADIIDIGGYSTRPGALDISEDEEIARVVPAVQAIRNAGIALPISIDTFRAAVAEQAVAAGANCINDVTACRRDARMAALAARLRVPVVLMHSHGDAGKDKRYGDVMRDIRQELGDATRLALNAGVRRWNLIADPGIGFSKTIDGNLTAIRDLGKLTAQDPQPPHTFRWGIYSLSHPLADLPILVGTSRKSFLGRLTGQETQPKERDFATAAAVTASVQQGCDIVRVHNIAALRDVVRVADALWRRRL
ncbi:Dihydropteroate synthase [Auriculariales sp. MPI-PUGE-AT-0066]|nr:Dihydropteroate synthase [Auriculariales sp. MPI-PUGE-AT-0066]